MPLVNLTKHPLVLHDTRGDPIEVPPDPRHIGVVAMGEHRTVDDDRGHTFSWNIQTVREVKGMPDPEPGTLYVVPAEVAMALQAYREDVAFPADDAQVPGPAAGQIQRVTPLRRIVSRLP